ncbi:hypothetical protein IG193_06885 [Infirmifilum lucidum]|uniref:Uncharacterized protein n=1 Tax=Infirmifilum lucidum TaxID=2776706 RepID=A0A7L9FHJ7_9CREN|nr:hypothetical protein [Infirmifilum lucidum]QOJ78473.1 hypothetical protein IG193_06885 [Infirmifilum lucidum]
MKSDRSLRGLAVKLIITGFTLLAIGVILAGSVSYQTLPREKIPVTVRLPLDRSEVYPLPSGLSQKTYFNLSYRGDRFVDLTLIFYDENFQEVGRLIIRDAAKNNSGVLYLSARPSFLAINSSCGKCNSTVRLSLYFARYNQEAVNLQSIASTLLAVAGSVTLIAGGYVYVLSEKKGEASAPKSSQEEPVQRQ